MKLATVLMAVALVLAGSLTALKADQPNGAGHVALAFTGGATWTSASTGTCIWYLPVVGALGVTAQGVSPALFSDPNNPTIETAYLIWVSDFGTVMLPGNGPVTQVLVPAGQATIYFSANPTTRDWSNRSTWGQPVAVFVRDAGLLTSPDGFMSDSFIFSADLASARTFMLNGRPFNFRDLIPNGMTCFESGRNSSTTETGSCLAIGR